jgi:hypothetical protein
MNNATLTTIYLILENQAKVFFLNYISCKENKCGKNFKIRKPLFKFSLYLHREIGNFRV